MDDDKEAGEIEDSDEDLCAAPPSTSNIPGGVFDRMMLEHRALTEVQMNALDNDSRSTASSYRSNTPRGLSSSSESVDSEEESMLWQCKRKKYHEKKRREKQEKQRTTRGDVNSLISPSSHGPQGDTTTTTHKVNNLWGNILAEQTLAHTLSSVDMERSVDCYGDRDVESYNYQQARVDPRCRDDIGTRYESPASDDEPTEPTGSELTNVESFGTCVPRKKRNAKLRVGTRAYDRDVCRGHHGITVEDDEEKIVKVMAAFLKESKEDLLEKIVKRVGKERSLDLLYQTEDLENAGGMMTMDGRRRRTAGGVYIQLFKTHPDTTKADIRAVFFEQQKQCKKQSRKRRRDYEMALKEHKDYIKSLENGVSADGAGMDEDSVDKSSSCLTNGEMARDSPRLAMDESDGEGEKDLWDLEQDTSIILE